MIAWVERVDAVKHVLYVTLFEDIQNEEKAETEAYGSTT